MYSLADKMKEFYCHLNENDIKETHMYSFRVIRTKNLTSFEDKMNEFYRYLNRNDIKVSLHNVVYQLTDKGEFIAYITLKGDEIPSEYRVH